jgi:hypothetical protein
MGLFRRLRDIFSPKIDIWVDFANKQFTASSNKKGRPVSPEKLAEIPLLAGYLTSKTVSDTSALLLPLDAVRRLYDDSSHGALINSRLRITFSLAASRIRFKELSTDWTIGFIFDSSSGTLQRTLPACVTELEQGYSR